jgi:hypothetical protein
MALNAFKVVGSAKLYPTKDTLQRLCQRAAQEGEVVGKVRTAEQMMAAISASTNEDDLDQAYKAIFGSLPTEEEVLAHMNQTGTPTQAWL